MKVWVLMYFWFSSWDGQVLTQNVQIFTEQTSCEVVMEDLKAMPERAGKVLACVEILPRKEE